MKKNFYEKYLTEKIAALKENEKFDIIESTCLDIYHSHTSIEFLKESINNVSEQIFEDIFLRLSDTSQEFILYNYKFSESWLYAMIPKLDYRSIRTVLQTQNVVESFVKELFDTDSKSLMHIAITNLSDNDRWNLIACTFENVSLSEGTCKSLLKDHDCTSMRNVILKNQHISMEYKEFLIKDN